MAETDHKRDKASQLASPLTGPKPGEERPGPDATATASLDGIQAAFTSALEAQQEVLRLNRRMAAEIASFASRRLEAGTSFMSRLTACRTPADLAAAQTEFWSDATTDYTRELQMLAQTAQDSWVRVARSATSG